MDPEQGPVDIVGSRVLVGVQTVHISRLSTHPIPMINGGLVTVAGQGPKDSNGAGKSSLIAAISLLHADHHWKLTGGAPEAAELLFSAELAAQEDRWSNADWGYVIGVFADPQAADTEALTTTAVSVWIRIDRKPSYVNLRWQHGLYVPYGATEAERAARVDALWDAMPKSNGRTDFHANRLTSVLYGRHARCVSFLSTSVRRSGGANLLGLPLNELDPPTIFDAIATLTGLDRELVQERELRATEHKHRTTVTETETALRAWEQQQATVEHGIAQRARARHLLEQAQRAWHARCARHLIDGVTRNEHIIARLAELDSQRAEMDAELASVANRLAELDDDQQIKRAVRDAATQVRDLEERERTLDTARRGVTQRLEELGEKRRELLNTARADDGRDLDTAQAEENEAHSRLEREIAAEGAANADRDRARTSLKAAESGDDIAATERQALQDAGITTAALLDVITLTPEQRPVWEPRLVPYRSALVIPRTQAGTAQEHLAEYPGTMLVLADPPQAGFPAPDVTLPTCVNEDFDLTTFLTTIASRAHATTEVETEAGVIVLGGFGDPLTGRATRVAAARADLEAADARLTEAQDRRKTARDMSSLARTRTAAAKARAHVGDLDDQIAHLRQEDEQREQQHNDLMSRLNDAKNRYKEADRTYDQRTIRIEHLREQKERLRNSRDNKDATREELASEQQGIDLTRRHAAWGDSPESAERFLLTLDEDDQTRSTGDWNSRTCHDLNRAMTACFPPGTPSEHIPHEIREILDEGWEHGQLDTRVRIAPTLIHALDTHLSHTEQEDTFQQNQIENQRLQRNNDLDAAKQGLRESEQAAQAHRASLAQGIKSVLKDVADEFDRLDRQYGGYGAGLDYPEPEPPAEPDQPWQWRVTPKWRRAEGRHMTGYKVRSNTAQLDEKAVKLVCAAALAERSSSPMLLILDELGRNLGRQHRREAVALFEQIGHDRNITVIGALQDDMERYAIEASGLYIQVRRRSDAMPYNEAPVTVGGDANHAHIELLRNWITSYRPADTTDPSLLEEEPA